jgi:hypothetical protein
MFIACFFNSTLSEFRTKGRTLKVAKEENSIRSFVIFKSVLPEILEYWVVRTKMNDMIGRSKRRRKDENCIRMEPLSNISRLFL